MKHLSLVLILFIFVSCQSSKPLKTQNPLAPSDYSPALPTALTDSSGGSEGSLISNGQELLFLRTIQSLPQVFVQDLKTNTLRRITFEKSANFSPLFHPKDRLIFYTSGMDELKEDPVSFVKPMEEDINTKIPHPLLLTPSHGEIYSISLHKSNISRRTTHQGYDGELSLHPSLKSGVFARQQLDFYQIYTLQFSKNKTTRLTNTHSNKRQPQFSPSGKALVWVEYLNSNPFTQLVTTKVKGNKRRVLSLPPGVHLYPQWSADETGILFSSNLDDKNNFELYYYTIKEKCLHRLTYDQGQDLYPKWAPEKSRILFTSDRSGENLVYIMDLKLHSTCPKGDTPPRM